MILPISVSSFLKFLAKLQLIYQITTNFSKLFSKRKQIYKISLQNDRKSVFFDEQKRNVDWGNQK